MIRFLAVVSVVVVALFVGACSNLSPVNVDSPSTSGKVAHFKIDLNEVPSALAKTAATFDGLTVAERKAGFAFFKKRQSYVQLNFNKFGMATKTSNFPIVNGVCEGSIVLDTGTYTLDAFGISQFTVNSKEISSTDFEYYGKVIIGQSDTTNIAIPLETKTVHNMGLLIKKGGTVLTGSITGVTSGEAVVSSYFDDNPLNAGYVTCMSFFSVKRDFSFYVGNKKYSGLFDITTAFDDNVVEMSVTEVPQGSLSASVVLADNMQFAVTKVTPGAGESVASGLVTIVVNFNHAVPQLNEMPNFSFKLYEVAAGVTVDSSTTGTLVEARGFSVYEKVMSMSFSYLKPDTKYVCRISGIVDIYGNTLVGTKYVSFSTKAV